jgi:HSP20 family protein
MQHAMREVDALKDISRQMELAPPAVTWMPHADVFAGDDTLIVRVDVPGIAREGLKVVVIGGDCVVRGERKPPENAREFRALALERPWGPFERRFALPPGSHPDKITARCADGVLELRIVKEDRGTPKEMKIELS